MIRLMKYEFRKTLTAKLILLGITAVLEIVFLISLFAGKEEIMGIGAALLTMTAFSAILVIGLQSIVTLHRDMNTTQAYMLFMTPHSTYSILGAKVLENGLSILMGGAFYFVLGLLDVTLLFSHYGQLDQLWNVFRQMMSSFGMKTELNRYTMLAFVTAMLTEWLSTVGMAFLADTVCSALLKGKKANGLLGFVIFIALSLLLGWIARLVPQSIGIVNVFYADSGIALVWAALMYVLAANVMDRWLSV